MLAGRTSTQEACVGKEGYRHDAPRGNSNDFRLHTDFQETRYTRPLGKAWNDRLNKHVIQYSLGQQLMNL
jgi:hypothetical protein